MNNFVKNNNKGLSLIEALLSLAIFSLFVTAFIGSYLNTQNLIVSSGDRMRAIMFATEGVEALKNIRDENFENLTDGDYGISIVNNKWELSNEDDLFDIFRRTVEISSLDENRKKATVNVSWNQGMTGEKALSFEIHFTNWMKEALNKDPLGYWPLDENRNCIASDIYNNHDGTLSPDCGNDSPVWVVGKINSALSFDGISNMVVVDNSPLLNPTSAITLSAWIKWGVNPEDGNQWTTIINKNGDSQYRLQHNNTNEFFEFAIRTSSGGRWVISSTSPEQGEWYHIAGTYNGEEMNIYVNGILENSSLWSGTINTSGAPLVFGNRAWGDRGFNGVIDEIGLWGRALSAIEIEEIYQEGLGGDDNDNDDDNDDDIIESCYDYCISISYTDGTCRQNPRQCTNNNETYESAGDIFCPGPPERDCCCK